MKHYSIKKYIFIATQLLLLSTTSGCFGRSTSTSQEPSAEPSAQHTQPTRQSSLSNEAEEEAKKREAEAAKKAADDALAKKTADDAAKKLKADAEKRAEIAAVEAKISEGFVSLRAHPLSVGSLDVKLETIFPKPQDFIDATKTPAYIALKAAYEALAASSRNKSANDIEQLLKDYIAASDYKNDEGKADLDAYRNLKKKAQKADMDFDKKLKPMFPDEDYSMELDDGGELFYTPEDNKATRKSFIAHIKDARIKYSKIAEFKDKLKQNNDQLLFDAILPLEAAKEQASSARDAYFNTLDQRLKNVITFEANYGVAIGQTLANLEAAEKAYLAWWRSQELKL